MIRQRTTILFSVLIALVFTSNCAYFNTFYLAKHHFNEGERLREQKNGVIDNTVTREFNDAIEWASEILREYADSRYVDDSLFIIGMSNYYQEEYVQARTKFDELLQYFPDSDLALSAKYYKAQSLIQLDQIDDALLILVDLNNTEDAKLRGKAGLSIAHINLLNKDWEGLSDAAQRVIDDNPDNDQYAEAVYLKGKSYYELDQFDTVIETLADISDTKIKPELLYEINSLLALSKAELGDYEDAMNDLRIMQNRGEFIDFEPRIRLAIGTIYELEGETDQAIEIYTNLAGDFPDSLAAKKAWYNVGTLLLTDMSNAHQAKEAFQKVQTGRASTSETWYADAQIKTVQIDSLISKIELINTLNRKMGREPDYTFAETDSSEIGVTASNIDSIDATAETVSIATGMTAENEAHDPLEQLAAARFSLAEVYTYSFDRPDSALTQYRLIIHETPQSEYAIKSRYFMESHEMRTNGTYTDTSERELMERLIAEYPASEFIQELKVHLGIIEKTPDTELFLQAEKSKLNGDSPDIYIPLYQQVIDQYPRTQNAYRAKLNIAYALERFQGDSDGAIALYQSLADEEPTSNSQQFIAHAQGRLDMIENEEQMLEDIANNIQFYTNIIRDIRAGTSRFSDSEIAVGSIATLQSGYAGMRKIRERNARIRSRYYTN